MTLHEIDASLPNGFHDAEVSSIALDLLSRRATLDLEIWMGDMSSPPHAGREAYRAGRLELSRVAYFAIDPPDHRYRFAEPGPICIDLCDADTQIVPPTRAGDFAARFFISDWNTFISVSAGDAALTWTAEPYDRGENE